MPAVLIAEVLIVQSRSLEWVVFWGRLLVEVTSNDWHLLHHVYSKSRYVRKEKRAKDTEDPTEHSSTLATVQGTASVSRFSSLRTTPRQKHAIPPWTVIGRIRRDVQSCEAGSVQTMEIRTYVISVINQYQRLAVQILRSLTAT